VLSVSVTNVVPRRYHQFVGAVLVLLNRIPHTAPSYFNVKGISYSAIYRVAGRKQTSPDLPVYREKGVVEWFPRNERAAVMRHRSALNWSSSVGPQNVLGAVLAEWCDTSGELEDYLNFLEGTSHP
jgi:hypothetical protein